MSGPTLSDRERQVLAAVIRSYVETAEPAGSRAVSKKFGLGVSPATIRNTMSDLEEKGYLFHPHTSAGRIPTELGYRVYVDELMKVTPLDMIERKRLQKEIGQGTATLESVLRRAAQSLGVLAQELGVALGPRLDDTILARLELVRLSAERLMLVLSLRGGAVRTIFLEVRGEIGDDALAEVQAVLNERLGGLTLAEIRRDTYDTFAWPAPVAALLRGRNAAASMALALVLALAVWMLQSTADVATIAGADFYALIPHDTLVGSPKPRKLTDASVMIAQPMAMAA